MGSLYIISTPIGNIEDITMRALRTLFSVDYIICEDTRITGHLVHILKNKYPLFIGDDIRQKYLSYRDSNEKEMIPEIIGILKNGFDIGLVTDAGTPLISDPGYCIVREVKNRSIPIHIIPGVSAFVTALTGSGLPLQTFTFLGYPPEKKNKRLLEFKYMQISHASLSSTYILYVAPHKLIHTLEDMMSIFGNIHLVIAKELTKLHEEFFHGTINECILHFTHPQGEFVVLFDLSE